MGAKPSRILDGLWQGGGDVLTDAKFFVDNNITHVISVCQETPELGQEHVLKTIHIDVEDVPTARLVQHFADCIGFIHSARTEGKVVYVHCAAGISRSSTITIAYLMTIFDCSYEEALHFLQNQRSCACPNEGFEAQLISFEKDSTNTGKAHIMKELFAKFQPVPSDKQFNLKGATMNTPNCSSCKTETKAQVMCQECGYHTLCTPCDEKMHSVIASKHNRTALMSEEDRKKFRDRLNAKRAEAHQDYLESKRRDASRVATESDDDDDYQAVAAASLSSSFSPRVGPIKASLRDRKDGWETEADEEEPNFATDSRADDYEVYHEGMNHRDSVTSVPEDTDTEESVQHSTASASPVTSPASSISEKKEVKPLKSEEPLASEVGQESDDDDILKAVLPGYSTSKKATKTQFEKYCR